MARLKTATRSLYGLLFLLAGVNHFLHAEWYVQIMPPVLPFPRSLRRRPLDQGGGGWRTVAA